MNAFQEFISIAHEALWSYMHVYVFLRGAGVVIPQRAIYLFSILQTGNTKVIVLQPTITPLFFVVDS